MPDQVPTEQHFADHGTPPPCQPWCVDHHDGGKHPIDNFGSTETVTIAGIQTHLSHGTAGDVPKIFLQQMEWAPEAITPLQAAALEGRLAQLRARLSTD